MDNHEKAVVDKALRIIKEKREMLSGIERKLTTLKEDHLRDEYVPEYLSVANAVILRDQTESLW